MSVKINFVAAFSAILLLSGCQSVEEKELQCHRCFTSTCEDPSFCNSTSTFLNRIHKDIVRHTDRVCPGDITTWQDPKYIESCHTKGSFCGKRVFKVSAMNSLVPGVTSTAVTPTGSQDSTSTAFPILKPLQTLQTHEYTFVMYSCTKPEKDCNKTSYSSYKHTLIVDAEANNKMDFQAEITDEPKTCAHCQRDFCNKASADFKDETSAATISTTAKFEISTINILILSVTFMGIHFFCDSMI